MHNKDIIGWWSGGATSAVACHLAVQLYGIERCRIIMIDTRNEDEDTYRFKKDCEAWYGCKIEVIDSFGDKTKHDYQSIQDVWRRHRSLNVAHGAKCSSELKKVAREIWQRQNEYKYQVFGFEFDKKEFNRALSLSLNHEKAKAIYPLLMFGYDKQDCLELLDDAKIQKPRAYEWGLNNNNCLQTGCVQGGLAYWSRLRDSKDHNHLFLNMAAMEHELTEMRGYPVTMLKDQSNAAKKKAKKVKHSNLVFLMPHPSFPENKCLADMKIPAKIEPLKECNGFCGTNELNDKNMTEDELNLMEE